jgi:SAM-dependent methyltransferase
MLFQPTATSYEEVPYANDPYPASHPDHLATVAKLAGLAPAPPDRCRVLELGCARGGNLIPMAAALPQSEFIGIDSSPHQIDLAREVTGALGLGNIALHSQDILDIDPGIGPFDYIICHGTFSWVPAQVRDKILDVAARDLAPNGLAYISYNAYPGWHSRGLVRELMCYHARRFNTPADRAAAARGILQFIAESVSPRDSLYRGQLKEELDYIRQGSDLHLLHDHLEAVNDPVYFHEFVALARSKGLEFVSEVQSNLVAYENFPPAVMKGLRDLSADDVEFEQFVDFLINRKFRQSVLCRRALTPLRTARPEALHGLYVSAARAKFLAPIRFRNEPLLKAALGALNDVWPGSLSFESLLRAAAARLAAPADPRRAQVARDSQDLRADLLLLYTHKAIELSTLPPSFVVELSEKPVASPLARLQAQAGNTVTNLRHEAGQLNEFGRHVVRYLDGAHDRAAIVKALAESAEDDRSKPSGAGQAGSGVPVAHERPPGTALEEKLEDCLKKLARFALLIA